MEDQQPQMSLDLSKTTPILTAAGGKIWHQGYLLRKVSKFIAGTAEDGIVPVPVFFDIKTGKVLIELLPKELREEFQELYDKEDATK